MKNEIKTHYFGVVEHNVAAAEDEINLGIDSWIPQDDIKVVGIELWVETMKQAAEYDSGFLVIHSEISKIAKWHGEGTLLTACARIEGASVTVAAGSSEVLAGMTWENKHIFFPDSKFVDLDEGEPLYLNVFWKNTMANTHGVCTGGIIYYIEK